MIRIIVVVVAYSVCDVCCRLYTGNRFFVHCALSVAAQCIVIGPVCGFVCVCAFVCLWVCCQDNSKLRVSILTKLGL